MAIAGTTMTDKASMLRKMDRSLIPLANPNRVTPDPIRKTTAKIQKKRTAIAGHHST